MTAAAALLRELQTRIELSRGSPTLLLLAVKDDQPLDDTGQQIGNLLRGASLKVVNLGNSGTQIGPGRWAEMSQREPSDAYLVTVEPTGPLSAPTLGRLLNAQRQNLRDLAGPLIMLLSCQNEARLREIAPDFFAWVAQGYEAPPLAELSDLAVERGVAWKDVIVKVQVRPPIRFLHISDLHLRPGATRKYDQDRVSRGLIDLLARARESAPLDLIFVTGDLAFSGKAAEYEMVCKFLRDLLDRTGVPPSRLFVVPGNHDVDRDVGRWLLRTLDSDDTSTKFFIEPESRTWHEKKFSAYREHVSPVVGADRPIGLKVGADAVEVVDVRGQRIAVASFNSAWFSLDDEDRDRLWLGEANVDQAGRRIREAGDVSLSIALMHHPTNYLSETERDGVEHQLERSFDIVLRGHLHKDKTRVIQSQRGGYLEVAAAAAYQGSQWPNGCFLGELHPAVRTVRLRPYAFGSGADPWVLDTKVFPDDEQNGYCHIFTISEKKRDPLGLREAIAAEAPAIVQSLDQPARKELERSLGVSGKSSHELEDKAIRALQSSTDPVDLWASLDTTGQLKLHGPLATRIAERVASSLPAPGARISRADSSFLWKALEAFVSYWRMHRSLWLAELGPKDGAYVVALHAFLLRTIDGPIVTEARFGRLTPDFFVGTQLEPPEQRAIIEVMRWSGRDTTIQKGVLRLDRYMDATEAAQGALAVYGAPEPEPRLEHTKTPAGRDALVLYL